MKQIEKYKPKLCKYCLYDLVCTLERKEDCKHFKLHPLYKKDIPSYEWLIIWNVEEEDGERI